jgi:hypothetical protein
MYTLVDYYEILSGKYTKWRQQSVLLTMHSQFPKYEEVFTQALISTTSEIGWTWNLKPETPVSCTGVSGIYEENIRI